MPDGNISISKEYLDSLPQKQMRVSGTEKLCDVLYDRDRGIVYLLDENGQYIGVAREYRFEEDEPVSSAPVGGGTTFQENLQEEDQNHFAENPEDREAKKKKKQLLAVVGLALTACLIYLGIEVSAKMKEQMPQETNAAEETTEVVDAEPTQESLSLIETEESASVFAETAPSEAEEMVSILVAGTNLIPGDVIDEESLAVREVLASEYHQLLLQKSIMTEDDLHLLTNMECNTFVSAGTPVVASDFVREYQVASPWGRDNERDTVTVLPLAPTPETLSMLLWGQYIDVDVTVQTKMETPPNNTSPVTDPAEETSQMEPTVSGVDKHTSVVEATIIDTYTIRAARIVDLLDASGNSLFGDYAAFAEIPAPLQRSILQVRFTTVAEIDALVPCYVSVAIPAEQATILDALDSSQMTVSIQNPTPCIETDLQRDTYTALSQLCQEICSVRETLSEVEG